MAGQADDCVLLMVRRRAVAGPAQAERKIELAVGEIVRQPSFETGLPAAPVKPEAKTLDAVGARQRRLAVPRPGR